MLSDTVGFISDLPTTLIAAFRATLEEVLEAELILHVRDIADRERALSSAPTSTPVLRARHRRGRGAGRLHRGVEQGRSLDEEGVRGAGNEARRDRGGAGLGRDRNGARRVARRNRAAAQSQARDDRYALEPDEGSLSNWIYENCEVVSRAALGEGVTSLRIRVAPEKRERLARLAGPTRLGSPRSIVVRRLGRLGLVPQRVHLLERRVFGLAAVLGQRALDAGETPHEFVVGAAQVRLPDRV